MAIKIGRSLYRPLARFSYTRKPHSWNASTWKCGRLLSGTRTFTVISRMRLNGACILRMGCRVMFTVNTTLSATASEIHKKYNCTCVYVCGEVSRNLLLKSKSTSSRFQCVPILHVSYYISRVYFLNNNITLLVGTISLGIFTFYYNYSATQA